MTTSKAARTAVAVGLAGVDGTNMRRRFELEVPGSAHAAASSADRGDAWRRRWAVQAVAADALRWAIPSHWR